MSTPSFRRGAEEAKAAAAKAFVSFSRTNWFSLKDGERALVRYLTELDEWITVDQHSFVPTRPAPADFKGNWPQSSTAVCRRDVAFEKMGYADCYVCEHVLNKKGKPHRPSPRVWGLAVLREEVMENGRVVGYRDQVRKVAEMKDGQATGAEVEEKAIVVINLPYKTFFAAMEAMGGIYGTILDRDYWVKRTGAELNTDYQIVPLDPIMMSDGTRFDLRDPKLMERYLPLPDLAEIVAHRASDDYFARFFDVRVLQPNFKDSDSAEAPAEDTTHDPDPALMAHYAARASSYGGGAAAPQQAPQQANEAPQSAAPAGQMRAFD